MYTTENSKMIKNTLDMAKEIEKISASRKLD